MKGKPEIFSENGVKMEENHSRVNPEENHSRIKRKENENNTVKKHFTTLQKSIAFIGSVLGLVTASITIYNFTHPKPSTTDSKKPQVVVEKKTIIKEKSSTNPNASNINTTNKESIPAQNYSTTVPSSQDTTPSTSTPSTNTQVENSTPQPSTTPSSEAPTTTPSSENINNTSENNTIPSSEENNIDNTNKGEILND